MDTVTLPKTHEIPKQTRTWKNAFHSMIENRDCHPFTLKNGSFYTFFACFCVQLTLLERENGQKQKERMLKRAIFKLQKLSKIKSVFNVINGSIS
jgi:hypothetical protein